MILQDAPVVVQQRKVGARLDVEVVCVTGVLVVVDESTEEDCQQL